MNVDQSRQLGQALMGGAGLSVFLVLIGMARRSYMAIAVPVAAGLGIVAALAFWVGYTMATTEWEEDLDITSAEPPAAPPTETETPTS
ncbi:MAG TPA: hypothetical protein QGI71_11875 [Dehalococcoidia bacterium]|jgi:hypothetical protein|nr:hypothetical protein [Dehalococcoidia bacterium]